MSKVDKRQITESETARRQAKERRRGEGKRLTRTTVAGGQCTVCWFAADDGAFESSGLLYRLHTLRRVVRWRVDERGDVVGVQFFGRKWDEKPTKLRLAVGSSHRSAARSSSRAEAGRRCGLPDDNAVHDGSPSTCRPARFGTCRPRAGSRCCSAAAAPGGCPCLAPVGTGRKASIVPSLACRR
jgi:hypothetical protein